MNHVCVQKKTSDPTRGRPSQILTYIILLPYRNSEIISKIEDIVKVLKSNKKNNLLIVTGKGIINAGLLNYLSDSLDKNKLNYSLYS